MGEGEYEVLPEEQPKKSRHRKKQLYSTILQQMEFYFSNSNLAKDRFLSKLLTESPYVDVEVFLQFNKIRRLNCSIEDIQKALKKSDLLELSEDGKKIHRKQPVKFNENVDSCTIYVENIKADTNHETLSQIFSDFGNVVYVSIPKYKHNKLNKGFAFIEYETEDQATSAVSFFESIGCKIPAEKNPEELQSILTFEKDEPLQDIKVEIKEVDGKQEVIEDDIKTSKKRKLSSQDATEVKKPKLDNLVENLVDGFEEIDSKKKKKNKKEKRKNYIKELGMQVLPKRDWKKLRNRYLDLQKNKMQEFKQYLKRQRLIQKKKDLHRENKESEGNQEVLEVKKLNFTPGVIVKLKLLEPCLDEKKLKNEIKAFSSEIQYVDVPLPIGSEEVFLRFSTKEAAENFCTKDIMGEKSVLAEQEEQSYWEKISNDRTSKFKKLAKKQRGRDKLLKKAEKETAKHLRFDENE